jgi:hypothetical protein
VDHFSNNKFSNRTEWVSTVMDNQISIDVILLLYLSVPDDSLHTSVSRSSRIIFHFVLETLVN